MLLNRDIHIQPFQLLLIAFLKDRKWEYSHVKYPNLLQYRVISWYVEGYFSQFHNEMWLIWIFVSALKFQVPVAQLKINLPYSWELA